MIALRLMSLAVLEVAAFAGAARMGHDGSLGWSAALILLALLGPLAAWARQGRCQ